MTLWMRSVDDQPHGRMYTKSLVAICGVDLSQAKPITEEQALVHLDNARCRQCYPRWAMHLEVTRGRAK